MDQQERAAQWTQRWRVRFQALREQPGEAAAPRPPHDPPGPSPLEQAHELLDQGRMEEAELLLLTYLDARPDDPDGWLLLATMSEQQGARAEAIRRYERAAWALPRTADAPRARVHHRLGELHLDDGRADRAARELRKALTLTPTEPEVLALLGEALTRMGELDGAELMWHRLARAMATDRVDVGWQVLAGLVEAASSALTRQELDLASSRAEQLQRLVERVAEPPLAVLRALHEVVVRCAAAREDDGRVEHGCHWLLANPCPPTESHHGHRQPLGEPLAAAPVRAMAVAAALRRGALEEATSLARPLLEVDAAHPLGHAALALRALARGELVAAREHGERAGASAPRRQPSDPVLAYGAHEPLLAALEVARSDQRWDVVEALARRALESPALAPRDGGPHGVDGGPHGAHRGFHRFGRALAEARARQLSAQSEGALAALRGFIERAGAAHGLAVLGPGLAEAEALCLRPLTLGVIGEFNSGKSTLVNALLGSELLPTGRLPLTACPHYVTFGATPRVVVSAPDGQVLELPWTQAPDQLRQLAARRVEIFVPAPQLRGFVLVDTPGLNSLEDDHDSATQELLPTLDGVLWVFRGAQPATESERERLEELTALGLPVLGVLNGLDALEPPYEQLSHHVATYFGRHLLTEEGGAAPALTLVSARWGLQARQAGDDALLQRSQLSVVAERITRLLVPQARAARQRRFAAHVERLGATVAGVRTETFAPWQRVDRLLSELELSVLPVADPPRAATAPLSSELPRLRTEADQLRTAVAQELLALRGPPRRPAGGLGLLGLGGLGVGGRGAERWDLAPADREYLGQLLLDGYRAAALGSCGRALGHVNEALEGWRVAAQRAVEALGSPAPALPPLPLLDHTAVESSVYQPFAAYLRGALRGDRLTRQLEPLKEAEPSAEVVARALERLDPDWEPELLAPLDRLVQRHLRSVRQLLTQLRHQVAAQGTVALATEVDVVDELLHQLAPPFALATAP
jgi:Flp pilus assembly protein TadD/GTPase SAR1 family protein